MVIRLLTLFILATRTAAQVPFQHFVVSTLGNGPGSSAWFADPVTGDVTPVRGLLPPLNDLSVVTSERLTGSLYVRSPLAAGMFRAFLTGRDAGPTIPITWSQLPSNITDVAFGAGSLIFVTGGSGPGAGLWSGSTSGGFAVSLGPVADAVEVAADGNAAYVLTHRSGAPSTIWRHDGGLSRILRQVVGGLPESTAFDVLPNGQLLVGTIAGDLYLADAVTGVISLFRTVGQGAIIALRSSQAGTVLFATERAELFTLDSLPNPLATLPRVPTDIELGTMDVPAFFEFTEGCAGSGNFVPEIGQQGVASLGNTFYQSWMASGLGGAPATFAFGDNRRNCAGLTLPFDLTPLGAPGCSIASSCMVLVPFTLSGSGPGNGFARMPLPIPNEGSLRDARFMFQWWIRDTAANPLGVAVSPGGEVILR